MPIALHLPRCKHALLLLALVIAAPFLAANDGISTAAAQDSSGAPNAAPPPSAPRAFENEDIKVLIPPGWSLLENEAAPKLLPAQGRRLLLEKNRYVLSLAYDTKPQSGATGDRFNQVFEIPWLSAGPMARIDGCAFSLRRNQQPASATLLFMGFLIDTANAQVRSNCAIQADSGTLWFGGFFAVQNGGYFMHSSGAGCGDKVYTLRSQARVAEQLPPAGDAGLKAIIGEASRIVNFIQYKRCAPSGNPN